MKKTLLFIFSLPVLLGCYSKKDFDAVVTFHTPYGEMKAVLYDQTPEHKENFIEMVNKGYYDSISFHRIIREFMIQSGDADVPDMETHKIPSEFVPSLHHRKGAIGAARRPDNINPKKESSGYQFYIVDGRQWSEAELTTDVDKMNVALATLFLLPEYDSIGQVMKKFYEEQNFDMYNKMVLELVPVVEQRLGREVKKPLRADRLETYTTVGGAPWLDDQYTVFGQVVKGLMIIDKIAELQVDENDHPLNRVPLRVSIEELPKRKITEMYGVTYPDSE